MSNTLLTVSGVTKSFKDVTALQNVDLHFDSGEVVGLVGGMVLAKPHYYDYYVVCIVHLPEM